MAMLLSLAVATASAAAAEPEDARATSAVPVSFLWREPAAPPIDAQAATGQVADIAAWAEAAVAKRAAAEALGAPEPDRRCLTQREEALRALESQARVARTALAEALADDRATVAAQHAERIAAAWREAERLSPEVACVPSEGTLIGATITGDLPDAAEDTAPARAELFLFEQPSGF